MCNRIQTKNLALSVSLALVAISLSEFTLADCNLGFELHKPNSIYRDNLDGTVTDKVTGLMWQKCSLGQTWNPGAVANDPSDDSCDGDWSTVSWDEALRLANTAQDFGFGDWYVPNYKELRSIVDLACRQPTINSNVFPSSAGAEYWSSSIRAGSDNWVRIIHFSSGIDMGKFKENKIFVRFVRSDK